MIQKKTISILVLFLTTLLLTSCEHKELCYPLKETVRVRVTFDWRECPDASPTQMGLWLYGEGEEKPEFFQFTNIEGGYIEIMPGKYRAIFLNDDSDVLYYRHTEKPETFEIYTGNVSLLEPLNIRANIKGLNTGSLPVVRSVSMQWGGRKDGIDILRASPDETQEIVLMPQCIVSRYSVEVRHADNLKYLLDLSASLTGMSEGYYMWSGTGSSTSAIIPFGMTKHDDSTIVGGFNTFGANLKDNEKFTLTVYAILADGSKWYYSYDVTNQVVNAPDPRNVKIIVDGLPLPEPITNGSGFNPEVEAWKVVYVDINM